MISVSVRIIEMYEKLSSWQFAETEWIDIK